MILSAFIIKSDKQAVLYRTRYDEDQEIGYELARAQLFPFDKFEADVNQILERVKQKYPQHKWTKYKITIY